MGEYPYLSFLTTGSSATSGSRSVFTVWEASRPRHKVSARTTPAHPCRKSSNGTVVVFGVSRGAAFHWLVGEPHASASLFRLVLSHLPPSTGGTRAPAIAHTDTDTGRNMATPQNDCMHFTIGFPARLFICARRRPNSRGPRISLLRPPDPSSHGLQRAWRHGLYAALSAGLANPAV